MMRRSGQCLLFGALAFVAGRADPVPPFTSESVLAALAKSHPEARKVDEETPPGVEEHEDLTYLPASEGSPALALDLYRPSSDAVLPAILIVHGGGWVAGSRQMERPLAKQLAAKGWVAAPVSYRLGVAGAFPAAVNDLAEAVRWIRRNAGRYYIVSGRIAVIGGSAGGTLALTLGANQRPDAAVQAVVDIDGTATFLDNRLIAQAEAQPEPYWEYVHGRYSESPDIWVEASPLSRVSKASAPTLFIESTASMPILCGREEMRDRLLLVGVHAESVCLPDTPHPFWLVHPWFERTLELTDAFLRRQFALPPHPFLPNPGRIETHEH